MADRLWSTPGITSASGHADENESGAENSFPSLTILLIDDCEPVVKATNDCLTMLGQRVLAAGSGTEGLAMMLKNPVDAIVCDLCMPGWNGLDVAKTVKWLREVKGFPKTCFVLTTGYDDGDLDDTLLSGSGVDLVVQKPADMRKLLQSVLYLVTKCSSGFASKTSPI